MSAPAGTSAERPVETGAAFALDPRALRDVFGAFPSGVVAVAGRVGGQLIGLAASSFTSVSLDPPLVSFSVARTSNTWPALREAGQLGISVLADHHDVLCRQLAGPADRRFDDLALRTSPGGAVLLEEAVATLTCSLHAEIEAGDHTIVLLAVHEVRAEPERAPLVFHRSGFKRLHRDDLDPSSLDGRINGEPVRSEDDGDLPTERAAVAV
ncbi:flavin reductase family protein [Nocardioides houyundeii]|uniref:flavin reductase family protein n=1 Tax=Nocardioides houyundeii TaxID=2045452 RepID=UPI0018EFC436|nr:flavin reductase family protein [Nocardioides houyundeii]